MKRFFKRAGVFAASLISTLTLLVSPMTAYAVGSNTWTDAGDAINWSDPANWSKGAVETGDHLVFDNTGLTFDAGTVNDLNNPHLGGLTFEGYSPYAMVTMGNPFSFAGNMTMNGHDQATAMVDNDIFATNKMYMYAYGSGTLVFPKTVYVYGHNMGLRSYKEGMIVIGGTVRGTSTVYVSGESVYGTFLLSTGYIRPNVVVNNYGLIRGQGKVNHLNVTSSGRIVADTCLTTGNLNVDGTLFTHFEHGAACKGYGQIVTKGALNVGGATLNTTGSLSYAPGKGAKFVLINNDGTDKVVGTFRGKAEGATFKIGSYTFRISYRGGSGNDIVLTRL